MKRQDLSLVKFFCAVDGVEIRISIKGVQSLKSRAHGCIIVDDASLLMMLPSMRTGLVYAMAK